MHALIYLSLFVVFLFLFVGFVVLFGKVLKLDLTNKNNKTMFSKIKQKTGLSQYLDRELTYAGIRTKNPGISGENLIKWNVIGICLLLFSNAIFGYSCKFTFIIVVLSLALQYVIIYIKKMLAFRKTDENLLKLVDFLGNYSLTSGEIGAVFYRVSIYMDEPIKSLLEQAFYEIHTTGDTRSAIRILQESVEHPKFKELMLNLEAALSYSGNLKTVLNGSRKDIREYKSARLKRRTLISEALIEMGILVAMSLMILIFTDKVLGLNVKDIITQSNIGRITCVIISLILFFYTFDIAKLSK